MPWRGENDQTVNICTYLTIIYLFISTYFISSGIIYLFIYIYLLIHLFIFIHSFMYLFILSTLLLFVIHPLAHEFIIGIHKFIHVTFIFIL